MCGRPKNSNRNSKPILDKEYQILKTYINGLDTYDTTKIKFIRSIEILFLSGLRVSEVLNIKIKDIRDGIMKGEISVYISKQNIIRHIPLSSNSIKVLGKLIKNENDDESYFIHKRNNKKSKLNSNGFTKDLNDLIQLVLGNDFSSHSFRKGLITQMSVSGINPKITQHFVGHRNVSTTLNYYKPTSDDIRKCLVR